MADVKFGTKQAINSPTPKWAKYTFRIILILTTAIAGWVAGTTLIAETSKMEVILILKLIDPVVFGISNLFGIVEETSSGT